MSWNSVGYLIKQGIKNTFRNSVMSLASVGVLFSCLLLIGVSVLLSLNIDNIISEIEHQNELVVFLDENVSDDEVDDISFFLSNVDYVETFEFVNKDEALDNYIDSIGSDPELFETLKDDNPLLDTFVVVLSDLSEIDDFVGSLEELEGVEKVNAPLEVAKMIVNIKNVVHIAGISIVSVLFLVALVIISNTIKITIYSRRKEINIMKFVGASDFFIKLPFVVEGVFIGTVSAILSYLTLWVSYDYLVSKIADVNLQWVVSLYNNLIPFSKYSFYIFSGFLLVGSLIGVIGSCVFTKKYLRV